jgi:hypothetical protein
MGRKVLLVTRIDRRVRRGKLSFLCVMPSIYKRLRVGGKRERERRGKRREWGQLRGYGAVARRCTVRGENGNARNVCAEGRQRCERERKRVRERSEEKGRKPEPRRTKTTPAKLPPDQVAASSLLELASAHPTTNFAVRTKGASPRRRRCRCRSPGCWQVLR